eukprot:452351_1
MPTDIDQKQTETNANYQLQQNDKHHDEDNNSNSAVKEHIRSNSNNAVNDTKDIEETSSNVKHTTSNNDMKHSDGQKSEKDMSFDDKLDDNSDVFATDETLFVDDNIDNKQEAEYSSQMTKNYESDEANDVIPSNAEKPNQKESTIDNEIYYASTIMVYMQVTPEIEIVKLIKVVEIHLKFIIHIPTIMVRSGHTPQHRELWWLDLDSQRSADYDDIELDENQLNILQKYAVYLNRELAEEKSKPSLYIPIQPLNKHQIIGTCYDAAMLCYVLSIVDSDIIDIRTIHQIPPSRVQNPFPLSNKQVKQNVNLLLSTCKTLSSRLPSYKQSSWMSPKQHASLLIAIFDAFHSETLKKYLNERKHPEIAQLFTPKSNNGSKTMLKTDEILKKWINKTLQRPIDTNISNYGYDMYNILREKHKKFGNNNDELKENVLNQDASNSFLDYVTNNMGIKHNLMPEDLLCGNDKLEKLLAARIFDKTNGYLSTIEKTTNSKETNKNEEIKSESKNNNSNDDNKNAKDNDNVNDNVNDDEQTFIFWINSQLSQDVKPVDNLY